MVERLLIANTRTVVREIDAHEFAEKSDLEKSLKNFLVENKPFVVRNAGKDWKVVQRWGELEGLMQHAEREQSLFPNRKYTVYKPEPDGHLNQTHAAPFGFMTIHKYLKTAKPNKLYLLGVPDKSGRGASPFEAKKNETCPPIFAEDLDSDQGPKLFEKLFENHIGVKRHVFLNSSYSFTNLHYDTDWNTYLCVLGKRAWTIAHPEHARILGAVNGNASYSLLRPTKGEEGLTQSRLAPFVKFIRVILNPGDVLCLPPTWWHVVEGLTDGFSCGINWFYTFSKISSRSPLDLGWDWAVPATANLATSVSGMGQHLTEVVESQAEQPDGAGARLQACGDEDFESQILSEVRLLYGTKTLGFSKLAPILKKDVLARQLVRICVNSAKIDNAPVSRFDALCEEVFRILANRHESAISSISKKPRLN